MKVIFKEIQLENFLSFRNVSLNLDGLGLVRIAGQNLDDANADSNDAGKTNFFNGLTWVLYEKLAKCGDARIGDEVINDKSKTGCMGRVALEVDGKLYEITRCRKHVTHGNKVFIDGAMKAKGKRVATNEEIERLIGMSYDMFLRAVFWAQGTAVRRLTQLTDSEYKLLFDEIVGTGYCVEKAKRAAMHRKLIADEMENERHKIEFIRKAISEREALLSSMGPVVQPKNLEKLEHLHVVYNKLDAEHRTLVDKARELDQDANEKYAEYISITEKKADIVSELTTVKESLKKKVCSLCLQPLKVLGAVANVKNRVAKLDVDAGAMTKRSKELEEAVHKLEHVVQAVCSKRDALLTKVEAAKAAIDAISSEPLEVLRERARIGDEIDKYAEQIERYKEDIVRLEKRIEQLGKQHAQYFLLERGYGPSGIRVLRLEELSPLLNKLAEEYSMWLTDGALQLEFSTTTLLKSGEVKESYKIVVTKMKTEAKMFGGGMRRRADLIAAFALNSAWESMSGKFVNLKVYDEATDGLDAGGELAVVGMLREQCQGTSFFVSHKSLVSDALFDRVLVVRRSNGISELTNG